MPRTLDPAAHAIKRDAFIDAAQRLIQAKGYEQMSIQEVLDETGASRGAFYHYFASKALLLDAVVERMMENVTGILESMVADPDMRALEKLRRVFEDVGRLKHERTDLLVELLRVWLSDENAIVRDKFRQSFTRMWTPLLSQIIRQGQGEGVFGPGAPADVAHVVVSLLQGANETAVRLFFARQEGKVSYEAVEHLLGAYVDAMERVLGLPAASLSPIDPVILRQWYA